MPFREHRIKCRAALERAVWEYVEFYERYIEHECIGVEALLLWKKYSKMVWNAHEAYHIAMELETGIEREKHKHYSRDMHDHDDMPPTTKRAEVRPGTAV